MTKVCIEAVDGGFSVYQEGGEAMDPAAPAMGAAGSMGANPAGMPGAMGANPAPAGDAGQVVGSLEEALELAGSMFQGGASPEQDDASAEALFQSGFKSAAKQ